MSFHLFNAGLLVLAAGEQGPAGWQRSVGSFVPLIVIVAAMYLLWIRPEQKRAKAHREAIQRVKAGDRIVTSGGIHGAVVQVTERTVTVRIADGVEIELEKVAIARVENPAEAKSTK